MFHQLHDEAITLAGITTTTSSSAIDVSECRGFSIQCVIDVNTAAAATFTAVAATDLLTSTAHGFYTGLKGQASTTTTLPGGLAASTDYYVIKVSADTYKLATSLNNALAGTAIDITTTGTGTHTFTPTSLAGATVKLQKSNDGVTYDDVAAATSITVDADVWFEVDRPQYKYAKLVYTLTAGSMSTVNHLIVKPYS